jgi:ubiquinone biosynthesis accessory factor UbiK
MRDPKIIDDLVQKLSQLLPPQAQALKQDLQHNIRSVVSSTFAKMDLVTREEFDVQAGVLATTRAKLDRLEREIQLLQDKLDKN